MVDDQNSAQADSPESLRYNRTRRWLEIADIGASFAFLIVILATRWSDSLRDLAFRIFQTYSLALFVYLVLLLGIGKAISLALDYYGFRLEKQFKLTTQKLASWIWDQIKGFLVSLVLGSIVVELLYFTIRQWPQHWWMLAWALFMTP